MFKFKSCPKLFQNQFFANTGWKPQIALLALLLSASSSLSAQSATILRGYVNDCGERESSVKIVVSDRQSKPKALSERKDSFPQSFTGVWQCTTEVTDSAVAAVAIGQQVVCQMDFACADDGRVLAFFQQPGWSEAKSSVVAYSPSRFAVDKTNYYCANRGGAIWTARSKDNYTLIESNKMVAESEVDQYMDGRFVGHYKTRSILYRLNDATNMAYQSQI